MSRIFRMSESQIPDWIRNTPAPTVEEIAEPLVKGDISRVASWAGGCPSELSEAQMVAERSTIEKCAEQKKAYAYNSFWGDATKAGLVEYASIMGVKTIPVNPESTFVKGLVEKAKAEVQIRTASASIPQKPAMDIGDAFKLDSKGDMSHMAAGKWQKVSAEAKTSKPDVTMASGVVIPGRGGETYELSPHLRVKPGQNSVADPDAISRLAEAKSPDMGKTLRDQNKERAEQRGISLRIEEKELAAAMAKAGFGAKKTGNIRMTEAVTAQPGLRDNPRQAGVFQSAPAAMPDKTQGELLKDQNSTRKAAIQRPTAEKGQGWQGVSKPVSTKQSSITAGVTAALGQKKVADNKGIMSFASSQLGVKKAAVAPAPKEV